MTLWDVLKRKIPQCLTSIISLNIGTEHYHKGKETDSILIMSYYTILLNDSVRMKTWLVE